MLYEIHQSGHMQPPYYGKYRHRRKPLPEEFHRFQKSVHILPMLSHKNGSVRNYPLYTSSLHMLEAYPDHLLS